MIHAFIQKVPFFFFIPLYWTYYFTLFFFILTLLLSSNSNMTSFFRFVNKRASYPFGIIPLAHAPVNATDLSIGKHKLCVTFSANVNINYCLPIKIYYRICTLRHIRIEINHGSQNVFWVLTWIGGYVNFIPRFWLGIKY